MASLLSLPSDVLRGALLAVAVEDAATLGQANKEMATLCRDEGLWRERTRREFPLQAQAKEPDESWLSLYRELVDPGPRAPNAWFVTATNPDVNENDDNGRGLAWGILILAAEGKGGVSQFFVAAPEVRGRVRAVQDYDPEVLRPGFGEVVRGPGPSCLLTSKTRWTSLVYLEPFYRHCIRRRENSEQLDRAVAYLRRHLVSDSGPRVYRVPLPLSFAESRKGKLQY